MPISLIKEEQQHILKILPVLLRRDVQFKDSLYGVLSETFIKRDDFSELKGVVKELGDAQKRTEIKVEELAEAQKRTEIKVEELSEAQKKTEEIMHAGFKIVAEQIEELSKAQKKTEETMYAGFKTLTDQISALGSRWGIYNEGTFRATIKGILSKQKGVEVRNGYYAEREVDIIISDGEHIMLEITSRLKFSDIEKLIASGDDYKNKHRIEPILMVATSYISPKLMQRIMNLSRKIEIFSYEGEEE